MQNYRALAIGLLALLTGFLAVAAVVLLIRGDDNPPIEILPPTSSSTTSSAGPGGTDTPSTPQVTELKVYISGAVESPGVYALQPGSRLEEALAAAGGATAGADLTAVNLALRVSDEGYYFIPKAGETPPPVASSLTEPDPAAPTFPGGGETGQGLLNLNEAPIESLSALPGIGPFRAQAIVDYRDQNGPFTSVRGIIEVPGVGIGTYEKIRDLVTVGVP